ncbi:MAG TPA: hypothetical protein VJ950_02125 [Acidimicrobiia bacterium]|nr:hypothetical protein [Acidimicrobiia bacterium]
MLTSPDMHITIVAAGDHSPGFALTHEIELVKAAVLYADHVTLASPRATMVAMVGALSGLTGSDRIEALLAMASQLPQGHDLSDVYTILKRKRHKTKDELLELKRIERELVKAGDDLTTTATEMATNAGLGELLPAIEEGVLDLDPLGAEDGDTNVMVERMSQLISDVVAPSSTTLPMFDDGSGGLLRAMLNEGVIADARLANATQTDVAARFISWVPAFPDAGLEDILGARAALRAPLVRYRSAIIQITRDLEMTPLDDEFESVVHDLHRQHVEPALLEIEELGRELGLRASISSAARAGGGRRIAEAAVSFAAAEIAGMPPVLLSALGVSADIAAQVFRERHDVKRGQRENQFYFLYEADKSLTKS